MDSIKYAPTTKGFGIALLRGTYRTGGTYYDVVRVDPKYRYVTLHSTPDFEKARALANREWLADKSA